MGISSAGMRMAGLSLVYHWSGDRRGPKVLNRCMSGQSRAARGSVVGAVRSGTARYALVQPLVEVDRLLPTTAHRAACLRPVQAAAAALAGPA
ncbi:hypothetical protein G6F23_014492 [Rhizopus arrhizus]|nr:hypothetical protein G6F23_014492 [Rhizopus arrhizus]KAG0740267.1 hypothetical protein G6F24_017070 [Rhizopus arrhizus]